MKKILLVEDNLFISKLVQTFLQDLECELHTAEDGEAGLNSAKRLLPHIILLDIQLPKLNGLEVLKLLRSDETCKNITIILMTAHASENDREVGFAGGCDEYIAKPFTREQLLKVVENFM